MLDQGTRIFPSPIVASKRTNYEYEEIDETMVTIFKSKVNQYDLNFFGFIESIVFDIVDNYELTNLILVTDSLSYFHIIKNEEVSVAYALFDKYENMTKPIPVSD